MSTHLKPTDRELANIFRQHAPEFTRARVANFVFLVGFGEVSLVVRVKNGAVIGVEEASTPDSLDGVDFSIKADAPAWQRFWQQVPQPGSHDIFALTRYGHMVIDGDQYPLMANLQFVKDLLAVGRGACNESAI